LFDLVSWFSIDEGFSGTEKVAKLLIFKNLILATDSTESKPEDIAFQCRL